MPPDEPLSLPPPDAATRPDDDQGGRTLTWAHLRNRHPDNDSEYWRELRALLAGGKRLLRDDALLAKLFPRHPDEDDDVYENRKARAFFIPYPGEIIGDLVGLLEQDPLDVRAGKGVDLDPFYTNTFLPNVDRKGLSLTGYAQAAAREALTVGRAWALCEMPGTDDDDDDQGGNDPVSLLEQEQRDLLRAYVCPVPAEQVLDWEEDDDGRLLWAVVHQRARRRLSPADRRDTITDTFVVYTCTEWLRYVVTYPADKPPKDDAAYAPEKVRPHTFGAVPLVRFDLPEGLWAMDKLYGIARAHLNQRSALSYAQFKHLFPILTAHLGPEQGGGGSIPSEAQANPGRATDQTYGIGRVAVFGKDDVLKYTSPDGAVFTFAAADLKDLRDEMHRVTYTMSASQDGTAAAVGRSGDSKREDRTVKERVLAHLGIRLCSHVRELLRMTVAGRRDDIDVDGLLVTGLSRFDEVSGSEAVADAQVLASIEMPSATFWRVQRKALARRVLVRDATQEELEKIGKEIDANTSDEEFAQVPPRNPALPVPGQQVPGALPGVKPAAGLPAPGQPAPKTAPAPARS